MSESAPTFWDHLEDEARRARSRRFADVAARWQAAALHRPSTARIAKHALSRDILPVFGEHDIATIRPTEIQAWIHSLTQRFAPSTVARTYGVMSAIYTFAIADGLLTRHPGRYIRLPRIERPPVVPPAVDDVVTAVNLLPFRYRAVGILGAGTGLRIGECVGLCVSRVDFSNRVITVDRQIVLDAERRPVFGPPKTRSSYRRVPLPDVVATALLRHLDTHRLGPEGALFTTPHGRLIGSMSSAWADALYGTELQGRLRFHDLRHFYASLLIASGESVKVVQARLGHATASQLLDVYAHLWPDDGAVTRAAIDSVLGDRKSHPKPSP